jgi:hypothetical protein
LRNSDITDHPLFANGMTPSNWTGLAVSISLPFTSRLLMKRKAKHWKKQYGGMEIAEAD